MKRPQTISNAPLEQLAARLTTRQAAAVLRCSDDHVIALVKAGKIEAINVGHGRGSFRIRREDLADYIQKGKTP